MRSAPSHRHKRAACEAAVRARSVKIGVFYGRKYYLRNFVSAFDALVARGHELVFAMPDHKEPPPFVLPAPLGESPLVTTALFPYAREDGLGDAQRLVRAARDAVRYERPPLRQAYANRRRAYDKLGHAFGRHFEPPRFELNDDDLRAIDTTLEAVQALIPPNAPLVRFLEASGFDAVLVLSRINFAGKERGVVSAARAAGVSVGTAVYSWDNLSSKALVDERPDKLFVWNDIQAREAAGLHGLDPDTVEAVGAPRFDPFFALSPSASREELLRRFGLDPARRTVTWLGSSGFVTKREPELLDRWLARRPPEVQVIVRPHPGAADEPAWAAWRPPPGIVMPPLHRRPQNLYDQLFAADAVVALNTSAELEAAIVGRPVLTIGAGDLAPGQEGSVHYRYLLADEGGFVETAETLDEHLDQLQRALTEDPLAEQRAAFLERFVRPRGLDLPVGPQLADEVEALGRVRQAA
jgi:hypothetical protein